MSGGFELRRRMARFDWDILNTLLFRGWSVLAGGGTALLIPLLLTPAEQGYYYTFTSVLAAQIFFELGLNHVLTQLTSHCAAHLDRPHPEGPLRGEPRWQHALASLLRLSDRWNAVMASLFFVALLAGGSQFFEHKGTLASGDWLAVWVILVLSTALNLAMSARLSICEGLGAVGPVAQLRLRQSVLGYALLWFLLLSGAGLWAAAALPTVSALFTFWWHAGQPMLPHLRRLPAVGAEGSVRYTWRHDIFPLQWRIAVSWASGYFIFFFITPVVFALQGPVEAGRLGLALTIYSAITAVGMSWVTAKIPAFGGHIARGERTDLDILFNRQARRSVTATGLCVVVLLVLIGVATQFVPAVQQRLPSMAAMAMLGAVAVANAFIFAMAAYIRAHKEEPLLAQAVVTALLIGAGVWASAHDSVDTSVAVYLAVTIGVALPWCFAIFSRYRQRSA